MDNSITAAVSAETPNKKVTFRGELALIVAILINSFSVVLMLYSDAGISAISSVPYAFSLVFPKLTLGTWTRYLLSVTVHRGYVMHSEPHSFSTRRTCRVPRMLPKLTRQAVWHADAVWSFVLPALQSSVRSSARRKVRSSIRDRSFRIRLNGDLRSGM